MCICVFNDFFVMYRSTWSILINKLVNYISRPIMHSDTVSLVYTKPTEFETENISLASPSLAAKSLTCYLSNPSI